MYKEINNADKLGLLHEDDVPKIISFYIELKDLVNKLKILYKQCIEYTLYDKLLSRNRNEKQH